MLKAKLIATLITVLILFSTTAFASLTGSLDKRFDADGKLTVLEGQASTFTDIAVQPDGKIVAVGYAFNTNNDFLIVRFNADGTLDTTFDGDGKVVTDFGVGDDLANSVKILANGRILVAGSATVTGTGTDFALARYNANGSLDTNLDTDGKLTIDFGSTTGEAARALLIQSDGRYVLAGATVSSNIDYAVARLQPSGTLDNSFDTDGKVLVSVTANADILRAAVLNPNDRVILVGTAGVTPTNADFGVVRLTIGGALDTTFDTDGIVTTDFAGDGDTARSVVIQSDSKILVCGQATLAGNEKDYACARYSQNGVLDTAFDTDGKVTTTFSAGSIDDTGEIVLQADGRIILVGNTNQSSIIDVSVIRYNADGTLDTTFDGDGKVNTTITNTSVDLGNCGVLQADGRLLLGGSASQGIVSATVVRYNLRTFNTAFDFDGDDKTDIGIFRPSVGEWWVNRSSTGATVALQFGASSDKVASGDFTGDSKTDIAFFRPASGFWFILRSEDNSFFSFPFGASGDIPAPADYDGDGKTDAAIFRPSDSTWYIRRSSDLGTTIVGFGSSEDKPVAADYDGDGKADIAIFRPSDGSWWYLRSSDSQFRVYRFGVSTDKPMQGDYSGDGKADIAVWRPSTGEWFVQRSEDNSFYSVPFGANGDTPVAGDYDGDGKYDTAVFRPSSNTWFIQGSTAGTAIVTFGSTGDQPLPAAFVP